MFTMILEKFPIQTWWKKNFCTGSKIVLLVNKYGAMIVTNWREWCLQINHEVKRCFRKVRCRKKHRLCRIAPHFIFSSSFFLFLVWRRVFAECYDVYTASQVWVVNSWTRREENTSTRFCVFLIVCVRLWVRMQMRMHMRVSDCAWVCPTTWVSLQITNCRFFFFLLSIQWQGKARWKAKKMLSKPGKIFHVAWYVLLFDTFSHPFGRLTMGKIRKKTQNE